MLPSTQTSEPVSLSVFSSEQMEDNEVRNIVVENDDVPFDQTPSSNFFFGSVLWMSAAMCLSHFTTNFDVASWVQSCSVWFG